MQTQPLDPNQAMHAMAAVIPVVFSIVLVFQALVIVPLWIAFKKAGLAGPIALIAIIPTFGPIIALFILAFSRWKVVPAPEYAYPPQIPSSGYPPAYPQVQTVGTPPATGYSAPGSYTPAPQAYPPPSGPGTER